MLGGVVAMLACAGSGPALADVLVGPHGERLPGHVIEEKGEYITFESDFLGRVQVRSEQAHIERDPPPPPMPGAPPASSKAAITPPHWVFDLSLKLDQDRGSLKTPDDTFNSSGKATRASTDGELVATVDYKYRRTDNVLKDDNWLISTSYDKFLSSELFLSTRFLGVSNLTSAGYDQTATLTAAGGWRLWEAPGKYVRIGPAIGYLAIKPGGEQTFDGPAIGFYARTVYPLWLGTILDGELQVLQASAGNRYSIVQMRLKRPISEHLYVAVDWLYTLSRVEVQSGIKSEWHWVLGWSFDPQEQPK